MFFMTQVIFCWAGKLSNILEYLRNSLICLKIRLVEARRDFRNLFVNRQGAWDLESECDLFVLRELVIDGAGTRAHMSCSVFPFGTGPRMV